VNHVEILCRRHTGYEGDESDAKQRDWVLYRPPLPGALLLRDDPTRLRLPLPSAAQPADPRIAMAACIRVLSSRLAEGAGVLRGRFPGQTVAISEQPGFWRPGVRIRGGFTARMEGTPRTL
jgi:hypothetical protein